MSFFLIDDHFIIHKGVPVSFILIGDLIINTMCIVKVLYGPGLAAGGPSRLSIWMLAGDPLTFTGDEADLVWEKFAKMGTPLEKV